VSCADYGPCCSSSGQCEVLRLFVGQAARQALAHAILPPQTDSAPQTPFALAHPTIVVACTISVEVDRVGVM
jgi:hypothetical protein